MIKHISFDFWDTLFKGNPIYRENRLEYLSHKLKKDRTTIETGISISKHSIEANSIGWMYCMNSKTQIWHLLSALTTPTIPLVNSISEKMEEFFLEDPPIPLIDYEFLRKLSERYTLSIACNTMFISGHFLWIACRRNFPDIFKFMLFSDDIGYYKPNPFFASTICSGSAVDYSEILHVGDNPVTDGKMCDLTGMKFLQVEKRNPNFQALLSL